MTKKLSALSKEIVLQILPKDIINDLIGSFYLPFLYCIENVLDNISEHRIVDPVVITALFEHFPDIFSPIERTSLGTHENTHEWVFLNDGFISAPLGNYSISTYKELDPVMNNNLIEFFISRNIFIGCGVSYRTPSNQWAPFEN